MATLRPVPDPRIIAPNGLGVPAQPMPQGTSGFTSDGRFVFQPANGQDDQETIPQKPAHFDDNLAETIDDAALSTIASDILEGIQSDIDSRKDWVSNYEKGMDLLGLKIDDAATVGTGGPAKSVSRVRHPLLLWAIIKGQSMARAELLPAAGPVKVIIEGQETPEAQQLAQAMEQDFNHYLTVTATEYYPDMDRGLFYLYYGGTIFKKAYRCPVRERVVSECVYLPDLIISNDATDIENALRTTHVIKMSDELMAQMQSSGYYLDSPLGQPQDMTTPIEKKQADLTGLAATPQRPKDRLYNIYECYTTYDLSMYGVKQPKRPVPYRISIDRDSRKILEIRRNWKVSDDKYKARKRFVKYGLVPGFGFLDLGFLHILGNHTKALTALWRICIDAGMFSNFPGGLRLKGARQSTNEFMPGPGEFAEVDGGPATDIRSLIMPMPYKDPSSNMLQMIDMLAGDGEKMAGTVDIEVGEGRTNVPVGTMMGMIEQQTQVMAACHKRMHTAQQEEFGLLKELFAENPEDLWRHARNPARKWQSAQEFANLDLVPASDPNVPSQTHSRMQATAFLQMLQMAGPAAAQLFNLSESLQWIIGEGLGMSDPKRFINPQLLSGAPQQGAGQPQGQQQQGSGQDSGAIAQAAMQEAHLQAQTKNTEIQTNAQESAQDRQQKAMDAAADRASKEKIAAMGDATKRLGIMAELAKHQDKTALDSTGLAHQIATQPGVPTNDGTPS